jgi:hypothetical protein
MESWHELLYETTAKPTTLEERAYIYPAEFKLEMFRV